jgi:hypothetical protein
VLGNAYALMHAHIWARNGMAALLASRTTAIRWTIPQRTLWGHLWPVGIGLRARQSEGHLSVAWLLLALHQRLGHGHAKTRDIEGTILSVVPAIV